MKTSIVGLRRRRQRLVTQLGSLNPQVLRGSLIERYKRCGKPSCHCAQGRGHGPKYYLSVSIVGKRPEMVYVPQAAVEQVKQKLANLQAMRAVLEELCDINRELLKRRAEGE